MDAPLDTLPARFEPIRELGVGGMGVVWEAIDRELSKHVAVKILREPSPDAIERLKAEFRLAADVHHPNLVRFGELFEHRGHWCFTMELIDGWELIDWVRRRAGVIDERDRPSWGSVESRVQAGYADGRVRAVLEHASGALTALHGTGLVHRDVKPTNFRVGHDGRVVLLDLGLAAPTENRAPGAELVGTVDYLAPELVEGAAAGPAADLYGLGAVLYELLTGRPPFVGPPMQVLVDKTRLDPLPPRVLYPEIPHDLDRVCVELLAREPDRRPTAADVGQRFAGTGRQRRETGMGRRAHRDSELVGRTAELGALLDAADGAIAPDRTLVQVVRGPAGVGKSALLAGFARAAQAHGHLVCTASCSAREHIRLNAWDGLADAVSRYLASLPAGERAALLPDNPAALTRLFPAFARVAVPAGPSSVPLTELLADGTQAIRDLLRRLSATRRVVSVLDDAQGASEESVRMMRAILAPPSPPMMIVLCVRISQADPGAGTLRAVAGLPVDLRTLDVGPLDDAAALELAERLVGDPERARAVAGAAGGNPLFLSQLAGEPEGPADDLAALLRRRVERLPAALATTLEVIAAAGGPVSQEVVATALSLSHATLAAQLERLSELKLVRTTGVRASDVAELFHDRVGEAALGGDDPERARTAHARLAAAIDPDGDRAMRCRHWIAAGDGARAAEAAGRLVADARDGLGFAAAVPLCRAALELALEPDQRVTLGRALATALAGAGETVAAADAFRAAALAATGDDAVDLDRLAAEHYLRAGRVVEGHRVARRVAAGLGLDLEVRASALLGRIAVERLRNRVRGTRLAAAPAPAAAMAADACFSLSIGLSMIDTTRAAWFTSRGVRLALDSGDRERAARNLALDGALVAARGPRGQVRAHVTLDQAEELGRDAPPAIRGFVVMCRGAAAILAGDYRAALRHCDASREVFAHCAGVVFEQRTAEYLATIASYWLGTWRDAAARRDAIAREAAATGDRYAALSASTGIAVVGDLVAGDPIAARDRIEERARDWPPALSPSTHLRIVTSRAMLDLYFAGGDTAYRNLLAAWPELAAARALAVEMPRATFLDLRGRAALTAGRRDDAATCARRLGRIRWARGLARLIEASLAAAAGDADGARARLDQAITDAERAGLGAVAAAARARRGHLLGGAEGAADREAATAAFAALGIDQPVRTTEFLAPWPADH